jgi:hypothetical protein
MGRRRCSCETALLREVNERSIIPVTVSWGDVVPLRVQGIATLNHAEDINDVRRREEVEVSSSGGMAVRCRSRAIVLMIYKTECEVYGIESDRGRIVAVSEPGRVEQMGCLSAGCGR